MSCPVLESAISPKSPDSFYWRVILETELWMLGMLVATGVVRLCVSYQLNNFLKIFIEHSLCVWNYNGHPAIIKTPHGFYEAYIFTRVLVKQQQQKFNWKVMSTEK